METSHVNNTQHLLLLSLMVGIPYRAVCVCVCVRHTLCVGLPSLAPGLEKVWQALFEHAEGPCNWAY